MAGCRIQRGRAAVLAFALGAGLAVAAEPRAPARATADDPAAPPVQRRNIFVRRLRTLSVVVEPAGGS